MRGFVIFMAVYFLILLGWSTAESTGYWLDWVLLDPWVHTTLWVYLPIALTILYGIGIATEWKIFLLIIEAAFSILD